MGNCERGSTAARTAVPLSAGMRSRRAVADPDDTPSAPRTLALVHHDTTPPELVDEWAQQVRFRSACALLDAWSHAASEPALERRG